MEETKQVTKQDVGRIFQDKKGLHEFLTVEMEYHLPSLPYTSVEWLRDIWAGEKKVMSIFTYLSLLLRPCATRMSFKSPVPTYKG